MFSTYPFEVFIVVRVEGHFIRIVAFFREARALLDTWHNFEHLKCVDARILRTDDFCVVSFAPAFVHRDLIFCVRNFI